jgi:hypothetical protein
MGNAEMSKEKFDDQGNGEAFTNNIVPVTMVGNGGADGINCFVVCGEKEPQSKRHTKPRAIEPIPPIEDKLHH